MSAEQVVAGMRGVSSAAGPSVSAVVCTSSHRRWSDVVCAVQSLVDQTPRPVEVLVVVDDELVARARATLKHGSVRILANPGTNGSSSSRNAAMTEASGDVVAYLDHEAVARPGWCSALLEHYRRPEVVAVGGRVEPRWADGDAPDCLPPELLWIVGCSDSGRHGPRARSVRDLPAGAMSFRRRDLAAVGGFSESLRHLETTTLGSEETDVCLRLARAVGRSSIVFEPAAVVDHRVTDVRTRRRYLIRRCWAEGVSKAHLARRVGRGDALSVERSYLRVVVPGAWRREVRAAVRAVAHRDGRALRRALTRGCALVVAVVTVCAGYGRGRMIRRQPTSWRRQPDRSGCGVLGRGGSAASSVEG